VDAIVGQGARTILGRAEHSMASVGSPPEVEAGDVASLAGVGKKPRSVMFGMGTTPIGSVTSARSHVLSILLLHAPFCAIGGIETVNPPVHRRTLPLYDYGHSQPVLCSLASVPDPRINPSASTPWDLTMERSRLVPAMPPFNEESTVDRSASRWAGRVARGLNNVEDTPRFVHPPLPFPLTSSHFVHGATADLFQAS